MSLNWKGLLPHIAAFVLFLLLSGIYFYPQLSGKALAQHDVQQYQGMSKEARDFKKETGETTFWTNAMFGGMPTYKIITNRAGNLTAPFEKIARLGIPSPIGRFFAAMLGFYIMMILLGVDKWIAIAGAVAFGFTTNNMILFQAGHLTQVQSLSYFPLLIAGILLAFKGRFFVGPALFGLAAALVFQADHPQMPYYLFLTLIILGIAELADSVREKQLPRFGKAVLGLIVAGGLALGSTASNILPTQEYLSETTRGKPILPQDADSQSKEGNQGHGLDWDYAMSWSNGGIDLFASLIPGVAGGSSGEYLSDDSALGKLVRQQNRNGKFRAPVYWGGLPNTSGPIYFGAVACLFFLIGLILVKGPVKWWLGLGVLLTLLLSLGHNLEGFNRFIFNNVPLYNKFRTPNSVLTVTSFLIPMLGFLGLNELVKSGKTDKQKALKAAYIAGGTLGAVTLFFAVAGTGFFDFASPADARYQEEVIRALIADRQALMQRDAFRSFLFIALSTGLVWAYLKEYIRPVILIAGIGVLTLFDLWSVGRRYLAPDDFEKKSLVTGFPMRQADEAILQDTDLDFRVFDISDGVGEAFRSTHASYFHKSLGGYHAAKLRRYQDLIERQLGKGNQKVIDMLNTRYFIVANKQDEQGEPLAQRNPTALGNAWLVDTIRMVGSSLEEINALDDFDPANDAVIHQEFSDYISGFDPVKAGSIQLTAYKPNHLEYSFDSPGEQLAVFSEIWYGPNKGWQAYIDGQPADHIRVNYLLRAMRIPAGQHKIDFKFQPTSVKTGKAISLLSSLLILVGLAGGAWWSVKNAPAGEEAPEKPAVPESPAKTVASRSAKPGKKAPRKK